MEGLKKPIVFEYLSLTQFLHDVYNYKKKTEKSFSYEKWAKDWDLGSRSFARFIVTGKKRLSSKITGKLAERLFTHESEQEYFFLLVNYSQAKNQKEKDYFGKKLMELIRHNVVPTKLDTNPELVSDPLLPQILSVFGYDDIRVSTESLSKIFGLSPNVIVDACEILEKFKMIKRGQDEMGEYWKSEIQSFWISDAFGSRDMVTYHTRSLQTALQAFAKDKDERRYKSLILPMNEEEFAAYNSLLDKFATDQMNRLSTKTCAGKRLYQANFNIYTITEKF